MTTREEIVSNDLGVVTYGEGNTLSISPKTVGNFFSKINTINEGLSQGTESDDVYALSIMMLINDFFLFYADSGNHYMFPKQQIADYMITRDLVDIWNTYRDFVGSNKSRFLVLNEGPENEITRSISRQEKGMTEIAPINASIDTLSNPSGKSQGQSTVGETATDTSFWNRRESIRLLNSNLTLKRIIEHKMKQYIYELNKIY